MKTRTLVLTGVGCFLLFAIIGAPIGPLHARFANPADPMQPVGLTGTLFNGAASAVTVNGRPVVRQLTWSLKPFALLMARLGVHITGDADGLSFEGNVAKLIGGSVAVDSMRAAGPIKSLLTLTGDALVPIDGSVGLTLDSLKLVDNFPKSVSGELQIGSLKWALGPNPVALGDLKAAITTEAGVIIARVSPVSGPLDVGGELRVLADKAYEVDLKVKAQPNADITVQNLVRSLGEADPEGYFRIKTRGQL